MNKVYQWSKNSIRVVCAHDDKKSQKKCELCKGKGFIDVGLRVKINNRVSPCCNSPWIPLANTGLRFYECSKCKRQFPSNEVIDKEIRDE